MRQMVINIVMENLLDIVLSIIAVILGVYVLPWLKDERIYNQVKIFVKAAEKLAESGIIEKEGKKEKVMELLKGCGINVDEKVEAFIEGAVKQLDLAMSSVIDAINQDD